MCLTINSELMLATKDIYVIKKLELLNGKLVSPFQGFSYKVGLTYQTELGLRTGNVVVERGFHSCLLGTSVSNLIGWMHVYEAIFYYHIGIFLSKIPKGSQYYLGKTGDIVSNKIEIVEMLLYTGPTIPTGKKTRLLCKDFVDFPNFGEETFYKQLKKAAKGWNLNFKAVGKVAKKD